MSKFRNRLSPDTVRAVRASPAYDSDAEYYVSRAMTIAASLIVTMADVRQAALDAHAAASKRKAGNDTELAGQAALALVLEEEMAEEYARLVSDKAFRAECRTIMRDVLTKTVFRIMHDRAEAMSADLDRIIAEEYPGQVERIAKEELARALERVRAEFRGGVR